MKKTKSRTQATATTDYMTRKEAEQMIRANFKTGKAGAVKKFWEWMYGQTCPIIEYTDKTSECGVYRWDLERWLEMVLRGKATFFD